MWTCCIFCEIRKLCCLEICVCLVSLSGNLVVYFLLNVVRGLIEKIVEKILVKFSLVVEPELCTVWLLFCVLLSCFYLVFVLVFCFWYNMYSLRLLNFYTVLSLFCRFASTYHVDSLVGWSYCFLFFFFFMKACC